MRLLALLPLFVLAACESGLDKPDAPPDEICDNLEDDDLDELADCADPDCAAVCGEVCTNGTDDDLDGLIDCLDDDCDGLCPENCGDGRDNDADGAIDCDDRDCFGSCPEVCDDGFDNDGDGKVDCLDEECVDPACDEICTDGRDNDADALVDCADDDCNDPSCDEACADGRDNDADGRVDCDDSDCDGDCPEICDDGRDNDADGRIDCDDDECEAVCDADGDGFFNADYGGDDCDDSRADVNPSRPEICNGELALDDDCDGLVDEDDPDIDVFSLIAWGPDDDGDGYGSNADVVFACLAPDGWAPANTDCDDRNPDVNPGMPEICNPDGPLDDDCDGLVDDADPDVTEDSYLEWYADRDGDGFGAEDDFEYACSRPDGTSATNDDCDDADPTVGPPSLWYGDADRDGFGAGEPVDPTPTCDPPGPGLTPEWVGLDCDDGDPSVYPRAPEVCEDGVDQDCDGRDALCTSYMYTVRTSDDVFRRYDGDTLTFVDIGPLGVAFDFGEVAWDPVREVMWMIDGRPREALYTVDIRTGTATFVGVHGIDDLFGLAVDPDTGRLYGSGESPSGWYELDPSTGAASFIGDPGTAMDGLTYDSIGRRFVGLEAGGGDMVEVDPATGVVTLLGNDGFINNCGLAHDPVTDTFHAIDWSGDLYIYDPAAGYTRREVASGLTGHDGLTVGPPP
ncbi:MAG: hypothetical protein ACI8PZ_001394 [Myxococcota bacterium]